MNPDLCPFVCRSSLLFALAGCAVNPVTGTAVPDLGKRRTALGAEQYTPTQQTQGGQFYIDPELTVYVREVGIRWCRSVTVRTSPTISWC